MDAVAAMHLAHSRADDGIPRQAPKRIIQQLRILHALLTVIIEKWQEDPI